MYVNYEYYQVEYGGQMPEEQFAPSVRKAESYIRYLTSLNGDIFAVFNDMVKDAVCAVADVYYEAQVEKEKQARDGRVGRIKSENNDGYSVTYVSEQIDGQVSEEVVKKKAYAAAYPYLLPTGWLSRKVRCNCADECGYHAL